MTNKAWVVAKINFRNLKLAYIITAIVIAAQFISDMIQYLVDTPGGEIDRSVISLGHYFYLLVILAAVFIPAINFSKIMHLNGKKLDFFKGSLINYILFVAFASVAAFVFYFTVDKFFAKTYEVWNLLEIFGWINNGVLIAFLQQFAFLFFLAAFIHTLTALQTSWVGWVVDAVIISIVSVFTPIAPLRAVLVQFFNLILFQSNAWLQIACCLVLGSCIYALNLPILSRKRI